MAVPTEKEGPVQELEFAAVRKGYPSVGGH